MAVYRNIQTTFWMDAKVADEFTPEDKYFYLYLFTNPHTNLCGCYEISKKQVALETGYSVDTIDRLIDRFQTIHKVISFDKSTREILLLNWHKYNWTKSDKFRMPLRKEIDEIKNQSFRQYLSDIFDGVDTVCIPYQYGMDTTVTVTDTVSVTDTVTENNKRRKNFVPPTLEEVTEYINENMFIVNPEVFYDYYQSNGWTINKNKMKDWKATVRNWNRRDQEKKKSNNREDWAF